MIDDAWIIHLNDHTRPRYQNLHRKLKALSVLKQTTVDLLLIEYLEASTLDYDFRDALRTFQQWTDELTQDPA